MEMGREWVGLRCGRFKAGKEEEEEGTMLYGNGNNGLDAQAAGGCTEVNSILSHTSSRESFTKKGL